MIVDDSALVRDILSRGLARFPGIVVAGTARDPYEARDKIMALVPDVLTLDVEMPKMDGVEFLRKLMPQYPIPVVMVSALTERGKKVTLDALEAGAVDFVAKPSSDVARGLGAMISELAEKVLMAAAVDVSRYGRVKKHPVSGREAADLGAVAQRTGTSAPAGARHLDTTDKIVVIGASTGGTNAIRDILQVFPADSPGVVVVQHMPPGFTRLFAERLDTISKLKVKEASDGDRILTGHAYIAPGGLQTTISRSGGYYHLVCRAGEKVNGHSPSVDVLMKSAAASAGPSAVGVILTGMGADGADGLLEMRNAGSPTIGQDEASSVVYGMPKVAADRGAVAKVVPLDRVADAIFDALAVR